MRWLLLLLLFPYRSLAQDMAVLLAKAAQWEAAFKEEQALTAYQQVVQLQPRNITALCHCSDLSCRIGNRLADRGKKIDYFKAGYPMRKALTGWTPRTARSMSSWPFRWPRWR